MIQYKYLIYSPLLSFLVYESVTKGMKTKVHRWSRPVLFVVVMFDGFIIFFIHFGAKSSITIWSMIHYRIRSFSYTRNQEFCDSNCDNCLISSSRGYILSSQVKKIKWVPYDRHILLLLEKGVIRYFNCCY